MQDQKDYFKGTSRKSRFRKALAPDYVQVDERKLPDLLNYAVSLSEHIPFFDPTANTSKHWDEFFIKDDLVQLIAASSYQIEPLEKMVNDQLTQLYSVNDQETLIQTLNSLTQMIFQMAQIISDLKKNLALSPFTTDLIYDISSVIRSELKELIAELCTYQNALGWNEEIVQMAQKISSGWEISMSGMNQVKEVNTSLIDWFKNTFHSFFYAIKHLIKKSEEVLSRFLNELQNTEPHIALLLVFLNLFKHLQGFQNQLTGRHLRFYYQEVLQMTRNPRTPDHIHICFQLKPGLAYFLLPQGTTLQAGKDEQGTKILYSTDQDLQLAATTLSQLATIFLSKEPVYGQSIDQLNYTGIFSGVAPKLTGKNTWPAFGEDQFQKAPEERSLHWARLGWVTASPCLYLEEGSRQVDLVVKCSKDSLINCWKVLNAACRTSKTKPAENLHRILSTAFSIYISTLEGLLEVDHYTCTAHPKNGTLQISFGLDAEAPAITAMPAAKLPEAFPILDSPFVQILINENCALNMYSPLMLLDVEDILINVSVQQSKNLKLYNNYGELLLNNPTPLFGAIPENDSYLLIGHKEAFQKNLTAFDVRMQWYQLPIQEKGISAYFEAYGGPVDLTDYQLRTTFLKNHQWVPVEDLQTSQSLFETLPQEAQESHGVLSAVTHIHMNLKQIPFQKTRISEAYLYTNKTKDGFFRLQLKCPKLAFGHTQYAQELSDTVLFNSRVKKGAALRKLPNPPFSPMISQVECDYRAQSTAIKNKEIALIHLGPFGYQEVALKSRLHPVKLLTQLSGKGMFMMGLDHYPEGGEVSFLFQMKESFYEEVKGEVPKVSWQYLKNNQWLPFQDHEVLEDSTRGFLHDGIIRLKIPKNIANGNTLMPADLLWIKAQVERGSAIRGHIHGIFGNAVRATWDGTSDGAHLASLLPPYTITKPVIPVPEVASILQPHRSFDGHPEEKEEDWTLRVSERLRHKNRAINARDFEELVLDRFDIIFKAQCFMAMSKIENHKSVADPHLPPGKVQIVVVPDVTSELVKDKLYPRLKGFKLMEIRDYLKTKASPFISLEVCNPYYEPIRVHADVLFDGKQPDGYYLNLLNTEIIQFMSSWLYSEIKEEEFGASVYKSDIQAFIQNRPYVKFVTEFSLVRIDYLDYQYEMYDSARIHDQKDEEEEIKPKFPWSIITSARQHDLRVIDEIAYQPPTARGIGNMTLESDFLID